MSYLRKPLRNMCLAVTMCGLLALCFTSIATAEPDSGLDDPMFIFCLVTADAKDLDGCLNGLPFAGSGDLSSNESRGYKVRYKVEAVLVDATKNEPVKHSIYCPHEFGRACDDMIDAVLAFGGTCVHGDNGDTYCRIH